MVQTTTFTDGIALNKDDIVLSARGDRNTSTSEGGRGDFTADRTHNPDTVTRDPVEHEFTDHDRIDMDTDPDGTSTDVQEGDSSRGDRNLDGGSSVQPEDNPTDPENISDLYNKLLNLFTAGGTSDFGRAWTTAMSNAAGMIQSLMKTLSGSSGMDHNQGLELASSLYNTFFSFYAQMYSNAYSQLTWYEMQDYNSPANQVTRLIEAGISPVWYFGSLNSGNATAQAGQATAPTGQAAVTPSQNSTWGKLGNAASMISSLGSLVSGNLSAAGGFIKNLADAQLAGAEKDRCLQLTPIESMKMFNDALVAGAQATAATKGAELTQKEIDSFDEKRNAEVRLLSAQADGVFLPLITSLLQQQFNYDNMYNENAKFSADLEQKWLMQQNDLKYKYYDTQQKFRLGMLQMTNEQALEVFRSGLVDETEQFVVDMTTGDIISAEDAESVGVDFGWFTADGEFKQGKIHEEKGHKYIAKTRQRKKIAAPADYITPFFVANNMLLSGQLTPEQFSAQVGSLCDKWQKYDIRNSAKFATDTLKDLKTAIDDASSSPVPDNGDKSFVGGFEMWKQNHIKYGY